MFDATMFALEKALDLRMKAHEIHVSNIANANVPDYKARKIDFDARMQEAMHALDSSDTMIAREAQAKDGLSRVEADVYEDPLAPMSGDGNTVNMDKEQTEIAKNTIAYEGALQLINKKFSMQKFVLSEGGR
jgi:flagellar basal-body rod protein FlgB